MTATDALEHAEWCRPRTGLDEPRIERYTVPRYDADGKRVLEVVAVVRCQECAAATYNGQSRD